MGDESNEGQVVLADAQFGIVRVMRPVTGFEDTYEGTSAARPVYLFPEGRDGNPDNVDRLAEDGIAGYDPQLARGLSVPVGARVILWLPNLFYTSAGDPPEVLGYEWVIIWRLRNLVDFRQARIPYHFPKGQGAPDTTAAPGQQARVPLPAAYHSIGYIQAEPAVRLDRAITNLHSDDVDVATDPLFGPLLPSGAFQPIQQGIVDPAVVTDANRPGYMVHEVQAFGDELLIGVRRDNSSITDWTFGTTDLRFSQFLGDGTGQSFPNVGVYAMVGAAP